MKVAIIIFVTSLSFFIGYQWGYHRNFTTCPNVPIFEKPSQRDYEVNNCSTEVEKAKKIYGEAFLLFLANIGVQLNPDQTNQLNQVLEQPHKKQFLGPTDKKQESDSSIVTILPDHLINTPFSDFLKQNQGSIDHIDDLDIVKKMSSFVLEEPEVFFARTRYIEDFEQVKKYNGKYMATIYIVLGKWKGETHDGELELALTQNKDGKIGGDYLLIVSRDGTPYSTSKGGGNRLIKTKDGTVVIRTGPTRFFHFNSSTFKYANYYEENKLIGFAHFTKLD